MGLWKTSVASITKRVRMSGIGGTTGLTVHSARDNQEEFITNIIDGRKRRAKLSGDGGMEDELAKEERFGQS